MRAPVPLPAPADDPLIDAENRRTGARNAEGAGEAAYVDFNRRKPAMSELRNCPFCGSNNVTIREMSSKWGVPEYAAQCGTCLSLNGASLSEKAAAAAWNNRPALPGFFKAIIRKLEFSANQCELWENPEDAGIVAVEYRALSGKLKNWMETYER